MESQIQLFRWKKLNFDSTFVVKNPISVDSWMKIYFLGDMIRCIWKIDKSLIQKLAH